MARTVRAADGGLVIPHACPAEIGVLSAGVAGDGRWHLLSSGGGTARCWPAGAGDLTDAPPYAYNWPSTPGSLALASLPGGSDVVVARASHGELLRWDRASGRAVRGPVTHPARQTRSPGRRALVIADIPGRPLAVTDSAEGGLRRWDPATGQAVGDASGAGNGAVWALAAGFLPDGSPVIVSGGADGIVRRWDPVIGAERGEPIRGCGRAAVIALTRLRNGQHVACVLSAQGNLHRRDLLTGEPVGRPVEVGQYARIVATHLDRNGTPTVFLLTSGEYSDDDEGEQVTWWRLDSGTRVSTCIPGTLRAVFTDAGTTWMVLGEPDGSLVVKPLDPDAVSPGADAQLDLWPQP